MDRIQAIMRWAMARLRRVDARRLPDPPRSGRPRDTGTPTAPEESTALGKPGFADEALPWLDAVHRFALQLTRDPTAAEDLVQETYLRAFRSWEQFDRGTNCRSWLFTICRNTFFHERDRASTRYEVQEADGRRDGAPMGPEVESAVRAYGAPDAFFDGILDETLAASIDALPEEFREVLVMSDLGDLTYAEISEVLGIPVGTVKSRLFRARRNIRETLLEHGMRTAHDDVRPEREGRSR
jgi:RNA polymerase sigma-70 factor, ECF subfamily